MDEFDPEHRPDHEEPAPGEPVLDGLPLDEAVRVHLLHESTQNLKYLLYVGATGREPERNALDDRPRYPADLEDAAARFERGQLLRVVSDDGLSD